MMKVGDWIQTPRFCGVRIKAVYDSKEEAYENGFTEPTYYEDSEGYEILGRSLDLYHMQFVAVRPQEKKA